MPTSISLTRLEALGAPLNRGSIHSGARSERPGSARSAGSRRSAAEGGNERERKEFLITRLLKSIGRRWTEQRLPALYIKDKIPHIVCVNLLATCGILFIAGGFALLTQSWDVQEYVYDYTDIAKGDPAVGFFDIQIKGTLRPPIWVYYEIDGFYQNHRNYAHKIDRTQMRGDPKYESPEDGPCGEVYRNPQDGRVYYPCGQIAATVFTDSFSVIMQVPDFEGTELLRVEQQATSIAWSEDVYGKWAFKNLDPEGEHHSGVENQVALDMWLLQHFPPVECKQVNFTAREYAPVKVAKTQRGDKQVVACSGYKSWNPKCEFERDGKPFKCNKEAGYEEVKVAKWGVESGHFLVWTRLAAWPKFRKAWGVISRDIPGGSRLRVHFTDEFEVKSYGARKAFVICDTSTIGGKTKIGWAYILIGTLMLMYWVQFRLPSEGL